MQKGIMRMNVTGGILRGFDAEELAGILENAQELKITKSAEYCQVCVQYHVCFNRSDAVPFCPLECQEFVLDLNRLLAVVQHICSFKEESEKQSA